MALEKAKTQSLANKKEEAELFEIGLKAQFNRGYVNLALFNQSIKGF